MLTGSEIGILIKQVTLKLTKRVIDLSDLVLE